MVNLVYQVKKELEVNRVNEDPMEMLVPLARQE